MNDPQPKPGFLPRLRRLAPSLPGTRPLRRGALLLALLSLPLSSPAHADAFCKSKVASIFNEKGGGVYILPYFRNQWLQVCNQEVAWKSVSPTTCTSWVAMLTSGMLTGKSFTFHYPEPDPDPAPNLDIECSTLPPYANAPSPTYVMVHQ